MCTSRHWALLIPLAAAGAAGAADEPAHLRWAARLVKEVKPADTSYRHKDTVVKWKGVGGATASESHTDCSGLVNAVLKQSYGMKDEALTKWLGARRPLAKHYFAAVEGEKQFRRVARVKDVRPGDLIAVRYPPDDPDDKSGNTGHVLLVTDKPAAREASAPVVKGTAQWEVKVIDQSTSGHGPTDARTKRKGSGVGEGVFRLYADDSGAVVGHSWSTLPGSRYRSQKARPLLVGRLALKKP